MPSASGEKCFSEEEIHRGLMTLVAMHGNTHAAARTLQAQGMQIGQATLWGWAKHRHAEQYAEMREKYSEKLEAELGHEFRDAARTAVDVQRLALERTQERLEKDRDQDPSRTAANLAMVADKMTGKLLSLTGRPTSIHQDRNLPEVLRALVARGILQMPEEPVELEAGDVIEEVRADE